MLARQFFKFYYGMMNGKIAELLKKAEAQKNSDDENKSSITSAEREFSGAGEAERAFEKFKQKLYHVNRWQQDSGVSYFQLFDENGSELKAARAETGKFIRIDLPGSGKSDWVKIIDIYDSATESVVSVQPTFDPTAKDQDKEKTSHFFKSKAVNNFCLQRDGEKLIFYVIGFNEAANTDETGGIIESVRNFATAHFGWLGFQKIEWQTFCENFLKSED